MNKNFVKHVNKNGHPILVGDFIGPDFSAESITGHGLKVVLQIDFGPIGNQNRSRQFGYDNLGLGPN